LYSLFLYTVFTIKTKFYQNNEVEDQFSNSQASDERSESDFDFDYDELVDNLDELEFSDKDLHIYLEEQNSMNESYITDGGFASISLTEQKPLSIFQTCFFTEEILNLITDQTNIYGEK